jgi:phosphoglycolate phosphatase
VTEGYRALIYDLDGTLARLDVDWEACAAAVAAAYRRAGVDLDNADLWTMLEAAPRYDLEDRVEGIIADHERAGARRAERLPRADDLADLDVPVGVCSLNCAEACRIALREHDLLVTVDAVVGRDTVAERKPSPEPLLTTLARLDESLSPGAALFVGDSERDEEAATRARIPYEWAYDGGPTRR